MKTRYLTLITIVAFSFGVTTGYLLLPTTSSNKNSELQQLFIKPNTKPLSATNSNNIRVENEIDTEVFIPDINIASQLNALLKKSSEFEQYHAMYQLVANVSEPELQQYLEHIQQLNDSHAKAGLQKIAFSRYVQLNADAAYEYYRSAFQSTDFRYQLLFEIMHEWAFLDADAVVAVIEQMEQNWAKMRLIRKLVNDVAFISNSSIQSLMSHFSKREQQRIAKSREVAQDPFKAFDNFLAMSVDDKQRSNGLFQALYTIALVDPKQAWQKVLLIQDEKTLQRVVPNILNFLAQEDLPMAIEQALNMQAKVPPTYKWARSYLSQVLASVANQDPQQALDNIIQYQDKLKNRDVSSILNSIAKVDVEKALAFMQQYPNLVNRDNMWGVINAYAEKDPQAAMNWAVSNQLSVSNMSQLLNQIGRNDPQLVESYLNDSDFAPYQAQILSMVAKTKAQEDFEQAESWLEQHKQYKGYEQALRRIVSIASYKQPEKVAEKILTFPHPEKFINDVVNNWYVKKPEDAVNWVENLATGRVKDRALTSLVILSKGISMEQAKQFAQMISSESTKKSMMKYLKQQRPGFEEMIVE